MFCVVWQEMYDATGVRLHAGRQAEVLISLFSFCVASSVFFIFFSYSFWLCFIFQVLNQIVYELPAQHPLAESLPLRELLGHTPPQVRSDQ